MDKFQDFIAENIAPKNAEKILLYDSNGDVVGSIRLGHLQQPNKEKLYSFCAISDVHIAYDTANEDFQRALTFVENSDCLFTCICGDLTQSGIESQLSQYKSIVDTYAPTKPVYAMTGNHENYSTVSRSYIQNYIGHSLYYSFTQGDDVFIMLGHYGGRNDAGWLASEFVSVEELQWLYETLETNRNKRCFIFNHVYPYQDRVGDANRYYNGVNWSTTDSSIGQAFIELLKHYKNTVLFHGHSHLRFHLQGSDEKANYAESMGYRSVHIPSLSVPRELVEDSVEYVYAESEGYIVDVYDNYIVLNGRDFIDNESDGHTIPIATYKIDTRLVEIEANTFTDSTGTITI